MPPRLPPPMSPSGIPESRPRNRVTIPRWMAIILALLSWLILIPIAHGVVPWAISTLMPRYGWEGRSPGFWNRLGLIPVTVAAALLIWILLLGIAQAPDRVKLGLIPSFLMMRGPYRLTRNPMYVAELGLWLGWALFFGSPGVFIGCVVLLSVVNFVILPREERGLEAAFGQTYLQYKNTVPRDFRFGSRFRLPYMPNALPVTSPQPGFHSGVFPVEWCLAQLSESVDG